MRIPVYGELPPDPRRGRTKPAPARLATAARRDAVAALALLAFAAGLSGAAIGAAPAWAAAAVVLAVAVLPLAVLAVAERRLERAEPRFALAAGACAALALLAGAAAAGAVVVDAGRAPAPRGAFALALLALAPLAFLAGLQIHRTALAIDTGGAAPRRAPFARALYVRRAGEALVTPRRTAGRVLARAVALAGVGLGSGVLVLADQARFLATRARAALAGRAVVLVHASAGLAPLAEAAQAHGHAAQAWGGTLVLAPGLAPARRMDESETGEPEVEGVRVTRARLLVPRVLADSFLVLQGPPRSLRRARRVLEHDLAFSCVFTWCAEARRLERRLNAFRDDVHAASTVEERSLLLQELGRLETISVHRAWTGEESHVLLSKLQRLRVALQDALLHDPVGVRDDRRRLAPGPVLAPDLGALVESGGLASVRAVTYVAYWLVPLDAPSGEWDLAVNAVTNRFDRRESARVLAALADRGPTCFVDGARVTRFVPPPPEPQALVAEVRRAVREDLRVGRAWLDPALADLVYVPFVDTPDGRFVNALTGDDAADVRKALPPVLPRGTLVG